MLYQTCLDSSLGLMMLFKVHEPTLVSSTNRFIYVEISGHFNYTQLNTIHTNSVISDGNWN